MRLHVSPKVVKPETVSPENELFLQIAARTGSGYLPFMTNATNVANISATTSASYTVIPAITPNLSGVANRSLTTYDHYSTILIIPDQITIQFSIIFVL